tara:strand:- start:713 stop:1096 length:384 start_codon:yes stop_codon:yes gene_type:complete
MNIPNITLENLVKELLKEEIFLEGLYSAFDKSSSKLALNAENNKKQSFIFEPNVSIGELAKILVTSEDFSEKIKLYLADSVGVKLADSLDVKLADSLDVKSINNPSTSDSKPSQKKNCGCSSGNNKY